jgi:NAD(P)-dependent dehydrogenase (short-subunit alcohol dehydrogenase family)
MDELRGKVAVVTGAASGIGRALAERFGAEGMKVVLADVERDALEGAAAALARQGIETLAVPTDVSRADDVQALARRTLDALGAVHVVCNNAGVFASGPCWEAPLEDYEWLLNVNLWGVIHGIRTFVPILLEQDTEAHVVNTASMAATISTPYSAIYNLTKHAVLSLSESLYLELSVRQPKIGVSALCPEIVATGIDRAERNRPARLRPSTVRSSPERDMVEASLRQHLPHGTPPAVIAERVLRAIRERRFYVLAEDAWREACETRLEDIRLARNPTFVAPVGGAE